MTAELRELYKLGVNSTWLSLLSYVLTFAISIITSLFPKWRASQNIGISSSAWLCLHRSLNNSNFTWSVADNNTVPDLSTILNKVLSPLCFGGPILNLYCTISRSLKQKNLSKRSITFVSIWAASITAISFECYLITALDTRHRFCYRYQFTGFAPRWNVLIIPWNRNIA